MTDSAGRPLAGARIEVWEADEDGFYDVQYADDRVAGRAHLFTDAEGRYRSGRVTPTPYPIPHDGPVGALLAATGRSPMRAAHLHFMVGAEGHADAGHPHLRPRGRTYSTRDTVFGVKDSLVRDFEQQMPAPRPRTGVRSRAPGHGSSSSRPRPDTRVRAVGRRGHAPEHTEGGGRRAKRGPPPLDLAREGVIHVPATAHLRPPSWCAAMWSPSKIRPLATQSARARGIRPSRQSHHRPMKGSTSGTKP